MDEQQPTPPPQSPAPPVMPRPATLPPPIITPRPPVRSGGGVWKVLALVFLALFCISLFTHLLTFSRSIAPRTRAFNDHNRNLEEVVVEPTNSDNKIAVVTVEGVISGREVEHTSMNLVQFISEQLKSAAHDSDVKAVILKVDSPGGEVMASDEINSAITKFQDETHKPIVASMGTLAASGGYYISAPCRWIVANEMTITGSIGVIMDSWNYRTLMDKIGIRPHVYKSGRFKDMLSGEREPDSDKLSPYDQETREKEDQMVQSLIDETYHKFKDVVRAGRGHAADENEGAGKSLADHWEDYADGRILTGKHALDLGFVDELGDFQVAVKRAKKLAHIPDAELVEYRVPADFQSILSHLFSKSEAPVIKVDLGIPEPHLEAGRPYYILPTSVLH
jgi:protease IV